MNKRLLTVVLLLTFVVSIFTTAYAEKVKIVYWTGWGGSELEDLKKIIDEGFNKKRTDIEVETVTIFGAYEKLLAAIAGGTPPDVVSAVWDSQLASLAARGAIIPLDNYIRRDKIRSSDFWPRLWQSFKYEDKVYALAATTNAQFTAFNVDMVQAAGLNPKAPPKNTKELYNWSQKLTKFDDRGNIQVLGYRATDIVKWARLFGGKLYDEKNRKILANEPKTVEAMEYLLSYNKFLDPTKYTAFTSALGNYWSPENPFFAGKIAMQDYGEWIVQFGKKYNPKLKYDIFPYVTPTGARDYTIFGGSMFCIPTGSKNKEAAWEFIKWITSPEPMKKIGIAFTNMPPRIAVAKDPEVLEAIPVLKLTIPLMEKGNAYTSIAMPVWERYITELRAAESMVINGQKKPKEALDEVTLKIQQELDTFYARQEKR